MQMQMHLFHTLKPTLWNFQEKRPVSRVVTYHKRCLTQQIFRNRRGRRFSGKKYEVFIQKDSVKKNIFFNLNSFMDDSPYWEITK